jgi:hypothetical protein
MSGKTTGKVWDLKLTAPKQLVLLALADKADHNDEHIQPGVALIAWMTGYSEVHVRRIIKQLVGDGLLAVMDAPPGKPVVYRIDVTKGEQKSPYEKRSDKKRPIIAMIDHEPETPIIAVSTLTAMIPLSSHGKDELLTPIIASAKNSTNGKENGIKDKDKRSPSHVAKEYDDVPKDDRLQIIRAWADSLEAAPIGAYKADKNHHFAAEIFRNGYRASQVALFVKAMKADGWWKGKTLTLEKVGELMPAWLMNHFPAKTNTTLPEAILVPDEWDVSSGMRAPLIGTDVPDQERFGSEL